MPLCERCVHASSQRGDSFSRLLVSTCPTLSRTCCFAERGSMEPPEELVTADFSISFRRGSTRVVQITIVRRALQGVHKLRGLIMKRRALGGLRETKPFLAKRRLLGCRAGVCCLREYVSVSGEDGRANGSNGNRFCHIRCRSRGEDHAGRTEVPSKVFAASLRPPTERKGN